MMQVLYKYLIDLFQPVSCMGEYYANIKKTIDDLVKTHTIIIVAHRLSTIMDADLIYVVDDGKTLISGTHDELMALGKEYKALFNVQSKYYKEDYKNE